MSKPIILHKICKSCQQSFPLTEEYFYRHPVSNDGFQPRCKECTKAASRERGKTIVPTSKLARTVGVIYFLQSDYKGLIKIGITISDLDKRISAIQGQSPAIVKLLATLPGTGTDERALHQDFAHLNAHHEWFYPGSELMAFIRNIQRRNGR